MRALHLFLTAAPLAIAAPAWAETPPTPPSTAAVSAATGETVEQAPAETVAEQTKVADADVVSTGVAKGRDRLDSAVSTSVLKQHEIMKLAPRSIAELLRDVPGIRSEAGAGEGNGNITIRGLPIASTGAKFVQLQEDGLPILEFGDIGFSSADSFLRADLNLAQVEVIRGGSASTFASNSPGGLINFVSKTGDVQSGAVQLSSGLDYDDYRLDFDYGTKLSDTLRFHAGGFYRQGEGPRRTGFDANKGGQIKVNMTKDFTGGYIRFYGKYLDDRTPAYASVPMRVSGTDSDPSFDNIANFQVNKDVLLSKNFTTNTLLDDKNNVIVDDAYDGQHVKAKSVGVETQFDVSGWTISERFRYADMSNQVVTPLLSTTAPAAAISALLGGPGASLGYATGPLAGQRIADPAALNGNGLVTVLSMLNEDASDLRNVTNDIRASRTWPVGKGELTTTAGFYASRQTIDNDVRITTALSDVRGNGNAAFLNLFDASGRALTQNGFYAYNFALTGGKFRRNYRLDYSVNAPFGSFNYRIGRLAVGGSLRFDYGHAGGTLRGTDLGTGGVNTVTRDIDGNGVISNAETRVGYLPLDASPVDYDYHYLSYSTGINFRVSEPFAVFARYSHGGRLNADRILFSPLVSATDGSLARKKYGVDHVDQAEGGVKYRDGALTLNLTGFWARADDTNIDSNTGQPLSRTYKAKGLEFEGGYRRGLFGLNGGVTYTDAEISKDALNPTLVGNTPRHQAKFIFQATPQISTDRFSVGAVFIVTTDSYAQDVNQLKMPGYVTTNAFVQFRPVERILLSLNANNLFDINAFTAIDNASLPAGGIVTVTPLNGRTVSASVRFDF